MRQPPRLPPPPRVGFRPASFAPTNITCTGRPERFRDALPLSCLHLARGQKRGSLPNAVSPVSPPQAGGFASGGGWRLPPRLRGEGRDERAKHVCETVCAVSETVWAG